MNLIPRNSLLDFDNIFNGFWSPSREISESTDVAFSPRVDIEEKKDSYKITAELPGIDKNDVHVSLKNGVLSIEAENHQEETEEQDGRIIRQERRYGKFIRSFNLGSDASEKDLDRFAQQVLDWPEVMECYLMTGDFDYLMRVVIPDLQTYQTFLDEKLTAVDRVEHIKSSFSLKPICYKTELPLGHLI